MLLNVLCLILRACKDIGGHTELVLPSSSHRFSGSRLLWRQRRAGWSLHLPGSGIKLQSKGMFSVSIRLSQLLCLSIILWGFAKLCFCRAISLLSVQLGAAKRTRCTAVTIVTHLCVLWFEFRYISVSCGGTWSVFSASTLLWQCGFCGLGQELRASCLVWCVCNFCQQSVVNYDSTVNKPSTQRACLLLYPSLSAFQYADGCLASYLGGGSPPVTCGIQGLQQIKKVQL